MTPLYNVALRILFISLFSFVFAFLGCQSDAPNSPSTEVKIKRSSSQLQFLKPKEMRFTKSFVGKEYITASQGGTIVIGDEASGYSSIVFEPGDLSEDTNIGFEWDSQGCIAELSPDGIVFNSPVQLTLSYKDADVTSIVEDDIQIWYFNEADNIWELIGGEVNTTEKRVEGFINHFSRYALAEDE